MKRTYTGEFVHEDRLRALCSYFNIYQSHEDFSLVYSQVYCLKLLWEKLSEGSISLKYTCSIGNRFKRECLTFRFKQKSKRLTREIFVEIKGSEAFGILVFFKRWDRLLKNRLLDKPTPFEWKDSSLDFYNRREFCKDLNLSFCSQKKKALEKLQESFLETAHEKELKIKENES